MKIEIDTAHLVRETISAVERANEDLMNVRK